MAFRENSINDFFNSKSFSLLMSLAVIASACLDDTIWRNSQPIANYHGIFFKSLASSITGVTISTAANVVCTLFTGVLLLIINKAFNFIRSVTWMHISVFLMLMAGNPITAGTLYSGTLMCLAVASITLMLFASFQNRRAQRSVFAAFALVSLLAMFQYAYLYLLIAILLGFLLMQAMNLRSFLAMAIGIATPFWVVLGTHLADINDFCLPSYQSLWAELQSAQLHINFISMIALAIITIVVMCANLFQIINYKLQVRAYNGFFVYLTVLTIAMLAIDYRNSFVYLPTLYMCFAIQFAQFFTINSHTRRYIAVIMLLIAVTTVRLAHYFL